MWQVGGVGVGLAFVQVGCIRYYPLGMYALFSEKKEHF